MIKSDREYRMVQLPEMQFRAAEQEEGEEPKYIVEGYATTYDDPYTLFEFEGVDMNDVIFLYNHEGMVYARQSNGTLELSSDERGLHVRADLGSTEASREMFESIKAGLVTQMSWAFTIADDDYNEETHTRTIKSVKKVFDVSAVSIPANPSTDIAARDYWDGVISAEQEKRRRDLEREAKRNRIKELLKGVTE